VLFIPGGVIELTRRLETSRKVRWPWSARAVEETPRVEEDANVPGN
jgi:hypothetical protein